MGTRFMIFNAYTIAVYTALEQIHKRGILLMMENEQRWKEVLSTKFNEYI